MATRNDWLTASSFEQAHEVASAINTLSIHAKLLLDGIEDPAPAGDVRQARGRLLGFLKRLQVVVGEAEDVGAIIGADPQMVDVAQRYLSRQVREPGNRERPRFLADLPKLVGSESRDDLHRLVLGLQELRSLVDVRTPSEPVQIAGR